MRTLLPCFCHGDREPLRAGEISSIPENDPQMSSQEQGRGSPPWSDDRQGALNYQSCRIVNVFAKGSSLGLQDFLSAQVSPRCFCTMHHEY
jgi:hypothetical protein